MAVTARRLRRIESWSDWRCAGGTRVSVLDQILSANATVSLLSDRLTVVMPIESARANDFLVRSILRIDESDTVFDEWRVVDRSTDDLAGTVTINAASPRSTDLGESALVRRVDSDGVVSFDFESVGLTPSEQITALVLPALTDAGISWISVGTVTPTAPIDLTLQWDSPLAVLLHIAELTQCEFDLRRDGTSGYLIDLVERVNISAQRADIRVGKNLVNLSINEDSVDQATRVFPRGAQDADGNHATMARAQWQITGIASNVLTLADPAGGAGPLLYDDQLNGTYLRKPDGTLTAVTDSDESAQTVSVASASELSADDLIQFRGDSSGTDLTHLDNPVAVDSAVYGIKVAVHDAADVPGTNNLISNPFMRSWPGTLPPGWSKVGTPTVSKQTVAPFTQLGGQSIKVESTTDGQGMVSDPVLIFPTADNPYVSVFAHLWVASGSVRVEMLLTVPDGTKVLPLLPSVASNSITGQWEDLGISGIDANALGATEVAIRVVQNGANASVFYIDGAQATETPSQAPLVEGSGGTLLWQLANEVLEKSSDPVVSYTAPLVDLENIRFMDQPELAPPGWAESALIIGAPARVRNDRLDADIITRILEINRDFLNPARTSVSLSNKFDELTDLLKGQHRASRKSKTSGPTDTGFDAAITPELAYTIDPVTLLLTAKVQGSAGTYMARALARVDRMPSGDEIDASTPSPAGQRTGVFPDLVAVETGKRFYVAGRVYNKADEGSAIATKEDVWLGIDSTPGADVTIGTIVAEPTQITYPVAFDQECAYCEIWSREFTADPGDLVSVENASGHPYRALSLGDDAMVVGVARNVSIPIAAPSHYLMTTFVPFDHLGKRGNVKTVKTQGDTVSMPGDAPDPPVSVTQTGATSSSIDVDVVMPATAPDAIRVYVGGLMGLGTYDYPVTVGGGATQSITIPGLSPNASYLFDFKCVAGTLTSTPVEIIGTTASSSGTLDTPTTPEVSYSIGDQDILIRVQLGANNPDRTAYHVEFSEVSGGPYTEGRFGLDDGSGALIQQPYAQRIGEAVEVYLRVWATHAGWTNSARMSEFSIVVPAS